MEQAGFLYQSILKIKGLNHAASHTQKRKQGEGLYLKIPQIVCCRTPEALSGLCVQLVETGVLEFVI